MSSDDNTSIDIASWIATLARNWWVIVGLVVLGAVADEQKGDVVAAARLEPPRGAQRDLEAAGHADRAGEGDDERPRREPEPRA